MVSFHDADILSTHTDKTRTWYSGKIIINCAGMWAIWHYMTNKVTGVFKAHLHVRITRCHAYHQNAECVNVHSYAYLEHKEMPSFMDPAEAETDLNLFNCVTDPLHIKM